MENCYVNAGNLKMKRLCNFVSKTIKLLEGIKQQVAKREYSQYSASYFISVCPKGLNVYLEDKQSYFSYIYILHIFILCYIYIYIYIYTYIYIFTIFIYIIYVYMFLCLQIYLCFYLSGDISIMLNLFKRLRTENVHFHIMMDGYVCLVVSLFVSLLICFFVSRLS